ncbi:hypothetical protein DFR86_08980 [Acidianus sulfidivorans JP7]|uniref:Uncharacterized protein n=1 Tax=Acidianus sulfidivorans JP7 TaxID=619593 RepID=A0A2U9INV4_9CREN|nr:hypothetical protein [Acidianus sulfidivorans]AWR97667.1 hypothetical protein DFR86_08980 [Acidianus sulfidivorans JP7]
MLDEILNKELSSELQQNIPLAEIEKIILPLAKTRLRYSDELHKEEIKIYEELAESLFEIRVSKYLENGTKGKGFDEFLFVLLDKMKEFFISFSSGNLIISNGRVLCKVTKNIEIGKSQLKPGDLVFLDSLKALSLWTAEYITLCKIVD